MSLQYRGNTLFLIVKVWVIYISCRYILLQKKLDLKVVKLYSLHSQGSFVFVHSIRIISLKMSDSTKERFYFIQNKFIWNYFYTIGDYNKYLNTIRRLIGRCNRYFRRWLYFNPSGFRYDPLLALLPEPYKHTTWILLAFLKDAPPMPRVSPSMLKSKLLEHSWEAWGILLFSYSDSPICMHN